jgi:hypothetical protein
MLRSTFFRSRLYVPTLTINNNRGKTALEDDVEDGRERDGRE